MKWKQCAVWSLSILLSLTFLTACQKTGAPVSPETNREPPSVQPEIPPSGAAGASSLEDLLSAIQEENIARVRWTVDIDRRPSNGEVASILRAAADRDHEALTMNGSDTDVVWSLDVYLGDPSAESWSGDDALYLFAGLEENVVEIFGGANLPEGRVWAEDEALYQLVRTSLDTPDTGIDQAAYEKYRLWVDSYLDSLYDLYDYSSWRPDITVCRELTGFRLEQRDERLGAELYPISHVALVDPPEQAPHLLAGGAYVDSRLRLHEDGNSLESILVVVDGEAVGMVSWELLADGLLDSFESKEALIEALRDVSV